MRQRIENWFLIEQRKHPPFSSLLSWVHTDIHGNFMQGFHISLGLFFHEKQRRGDGGLPAVGFFDESVKDDLCGEKSREGSLLRCNSLSPKEFIKTFVTHYAGTHTSVAQVYSIHYSPSLWSWFSSAVAWGCLLNVSPRTYTVHTHTHTISKGLKWTMKLSFPSSLILAAFVRVAQASRIRSRMFGSLEQESWVTEKYTMEKHTHTHDGASRE